MAQTKRLAMEQAMICTHCGHTFDDESNCSSIRMFNACVECDSYMRNMHLDA